MSEVKTDMSTKEKPPVPAGKPPENDSTKVDSTALSKTTIHTSTSQNDAVKNYVENQKRRDAAPKEGMSRREFLKKMGIGIGGLALTTGAGVGIVRLVDSINKGAGRERILVPPKEIPPTYDASATNAWTGPSNSTQMTLEESKKAAQPIWQEEEKTMTVPLPIKFRGDRIPTLHITKGPDGYGFRPGNDLIHIDAGLEKGDMLIALSEGSLEVELNSDGTPKPFQQSLYLYVGPQENFDRIVFHTTPVKLLITGKVTRTDSTFGSMRVEEGQSFGEIQTTYEDQPIKPDLRITGLSRTDTQENFNLATSSEKKIIILK